MKVCKICNGQTRQSRGYYETSCDACIKFFRRNCPIRNTLKCKTGFGLCTIDTKTNRKCCASCRFEKCLTLGMKSRLLADGKTSETRDYRQTVVVDSNSSSSASSSSSVAPGSAVDFDHRIPAVNCLPPLVRDPLIFDGREVETISRTSAQAFTSLHGFNFLSFAQPPVDVIHFNKHHLVEAVADQARVIVQMMASYCSNFFGDGGLTMVETELLTTSSFPSEATVIYRALCGGDGCCFFNMHPILKGVVLHHFPQLSKAWELSEQLQSLITEWQPSFVECFILIGLMFFNENRLATISLRKARQRLLLAYNRLLNENFDSQMVAVRQINMKTAINFTSEIVSITSRKLQSAALEDSKVQPLFTACAEGKL